LRAACCTLREISTSGSSWWRWLDDDRAADRTPAAAVSYGRNLRFHALAMKFLPRFQRRSELECHFPGDLKQPFDGRDVLAEVTPDRSAAHPFFDLARMLCGEAEHEDGAIDFSSRRRMQARDAGSEVRDIGVDARRLALRLAFAPSASA
jgi:hypothetical protein